MKDYKKKFYGTKYEPNTQLPESPDRFSIIYTLYKHLRKFEKHREDVAYELLPIGDRFLDVGCGDRYNKDLLKDAIFKVLSDEGLRSRFGEGSKRLAREEFSWDKIVKSVEDLYVSCLPSIEQKVI